jgi:hypothetical protein
METETRESAFTIDFSYEADVPAHKVVQGLVELTVELVEVGGARIEGVVGRVDDDGIHLWMPNDLTEPSVHGWDHIESVWVF